MSEHGSKTSTMPVVWAIFGVFHCSPNDFLLQLVTMDETWLYHYDLETKQQSMEWWHSGSHTHTHPHQKKIPSAKICWKSSHLNFLGSRRHPSKGPNFQRGVLLISAGAIEGHFEGKMLREVHLGGSCSCTTMPRLTGHLQPRRNWPTWASSVLITHPVLRIWPRRATTCSLWTEKNNWKVTIFHPTRRSLLPQGPGWTDNLLNFFFEWLAKVRATD